MSWPMYTSLTPFLFRCISKICIDENTAKTIIATLSEKPQNHNETGGDCYNSFVCRLMVLSMTA